MVTDLVDAANAARRSARVDHDAERRLEALFGCSERLAVYGSLRPGRENHDVVQPLGGTWSEGVVEGDLTRYGWGAAMGHLALRLRPGRSPVAVHVLTSPKLPGAWSELDAFEGAEYRRVLAPVWSADTGPSRALLTIANLYEAASPASAPNPPPSSS